MPLVTILVEDSPTIRENLVPALLELIDARVDMVAETEGEALRCLLDKGDTWQLMLVDLFLREGSGLGVLRACQVRAPHQRVIVLTNYPTAVIRERCLELGADAIFDKSNELEAFFEYCTRLSHP